MNDLTTERSCGHPAYRFAAGGARCPSVESSRTSRYEAKARSSGNPIVCATNSGRTLVEFDYDGHHRVVAPYCHGLTRKNVEALRAIQPRQSISSMR
jgi:hypothetical protein